MTYPTKTLNYQSTPVRVFNRDQETYVIARDVCKALGISRYPLKTKLSNDQRTSVLTRKLETTLPASHYSALTLEDTRQFLSHYPDLGMSFYTWLVDEAATFADEIQHEKDTSEWVPAEEAISEIDEHPVSFLWDVPEDDKDYRQRPDGLWRLFVRFPRKERESAQGAPSGDGAVKQPTLRLPQSPQQRTQEARMRFKNAVKAIARKMGGKSEDYRAAYGRVYSAFRTPDNRNVYGLKAYYNTDSFIDAIEEADLFDEATATAEAILNDL